MSCALVAGGSDIRSHDLKASQHSNAFLQGFLDFADTAPDHFASRTSSEQVSFGELHARMCGFAHMFAKRGIAAGDRVVILVPAGSDFLGCTYALFYLQAIPIFIDPGVGLKKLLACVRQSAATWVVAAPKVKILRLLAPSTFRALRGVIYIDGAFRAAAHGQTAQRASAPQSQVMVAYTSGATGRPKGVVFTPLMAQAICDILRHTFGLNAGGCDMALLPIFSIFNLALGRTSVLPRMDAAHPLSLDEREVVSLIERCAVDSAFGSPTLWQKISSYANSQRIVFPRVKQIFMAGAPVRAEVQQAVAKLLPNGEVYTPYGSTEALPVTLIGAAELSQTQQVAALSGERGTLVGKPIGQALVLLAHVSDGVAEDRKVVPAAEREIAEILVSGPHISQSYLADEEASKYAKIHFDGLLWHRMGDLGYFDAQGNLYFCGRVAHAVREGDRVLSTIPLERIFNQHASVERSALVRLPAPWNVGVVVEPKKAAMSSVFPTWPAALFSSGRRRFEGELRQLALSDPLSAKIERFFFHRSFPVDGRHNAKIFRDQLARWAARRI